MKTMTTPQPDRWEKEIRRTAHKIVNRSMERWKWDGIGMPEILTEEIIKYLKGVKSK